jgi:hypothetical protein
MHGKTLETGISGVHEELFAEMGKCLRPEADESLLRTLRDDLEDRLESARRGEGRGSNSGASNGSALEELLRKWDETLSNALQLAPQKGIISGDLDAELERLYADHVAVPRAAARVGAPGSRGQMRSYCSQVFRQARLWDRIQKSVDRTLRDAGIEPIPLNHFAVWVGKLKPMIQ